MFTYKLFENGEQSVIFFEGDIDIDVTDLMETEIQPMLVKYTTIEMNFSEVYFVDSTGIGLLIKIVQALLELGRAVRITHVRPEVMEVFEFLQIEDIFGENVLA
ncbi:STAS domain-containing protein [Paenibacillus turpanensis]|uniref:STAS domain-containing protein n=1 Tax=Paenibacillus turpanensis TaxID=2689078 RepID=UPI0014080C3D|nr:STAS domain-containing protein [Paenibacillus turpanensis]